MTPDNEALVANDDDFTIVEDTTLTGSVIDNDREVDRSTAMVTEVTGTNNGTLTLNADGTFEYIPDADFFGTDTFTYQLEDSTGATSTATVTITVDGTNDAPTVIDNGGAISEGGELTLTSAMLVATDIDDAPGDLTFTVDSTGNGQVELTTAPGTAITSFTQAQVDSGQVVFVHDGSETTAAHFDYTLADGGEDGVMSIPDTFNLTVSPENDAPEATDDVYTTAEGGTLNVGPLTGLLVNDSDVDSAIQVSSVFGASHGTVTFGTDGSFTYIHDGTETTGDSFTYTIDDGNGGTDTATVNIDHTGQRCTRDCRRVSDDN